MSTRCARGGRYRAGFRVPVLTALALALLPAVAPGQEIGELLEEAATPLFPDIRFVGEVGYRWQGEADIDSGGDLTVNRFYTGLASRTNLTESLRWNNSYFFGVGDYDFGGVGGADPWETVLHMRMGSRLTYELGEHWGVSGGGVLTFAPETGADWGDAITAGGTVGVEYRGGENFYVSVGVAVISQIEDDATVAPSVALSWLPHPKWAVRIGSVPASGGTAAAAEVAYRIVEPLEIGLGALYHERRFRLDDSGVAPNGVGEDNTLPVRLRLGWDITDRISLHTVVGAVLAGNLRIENSSGNRLVDTDYDPAPYVGIRIGGRFWSR